MLPAGNVCLRTQVVIAVGDCHIVILVFVWHRLGEWGEVTCWYFVRVEYAFVYDFFAFVDLAVARCVFSAEFVTEFG